MSLSEIPPPPVRTTSRHIVDTLIEERAERLMANPVLWRTVKTLAYPLLRYDTAVEVADALAPLRGLDPINWCSRFLGMTKDAQGMERVPEAGAVVIVANHPGGLTDSIAVWDVLSPRRPDICYFANRDCLRVSPGFESVVIPVEWRPEKRTRAMTRETLVKTAEAFGAGRCVVVFPSGRMAQWSWSRMGIREEPWMTTAVSIARKYKAPIVPLGLAQHMSLAYYSFAQVSEELRNMTVFYELLAKRGAHYRMRFGEPLDPMSLPADETEATEALKAMCETLAWDVE